MSEYSGYLPYNTHRVIDLDQEAWRKIKTAASLSPWIPPEYFMDDWVNDVCKFLEGTLHK